MTAPPRRWLTPVAAVLTALAVLAGPVPASATPTSPPQPSGHDEEPELLGDLIEVRNREYVKAKAQLTESEKRQSVLETEIEKAQAELDELGSQVAEIAAQSYRTGRVGAISTLLDADTPDSFIARATALDELNRVNDQRIKAVNTIKTRAEQAKVGIDEEVRKQQKLKSDLERGKLEAEKALRLVGGNGLTGGLVDAESPVARVAPGRTSDGDWKPLGCTEDDPTTGGCITARTLHMYNEVKRAGFDRFVGCYRSGGPWEHPKGRACDWSLQDSGFRPWYNNDMRLYGNNLTAFLVRNADRLGIYYVIWNRQIWFPATGWKSYSGPSNHTDHVHVSLL
ncbi:coiled-coil domain-containing protein [Salinispora mooreana]|uniref:coiled-coil domain-containing protein n=1 Tax=Salinispora mooreana TaxID=999545 RepID=UPI0004759F1F|nr:hypothetical protein [Salinispora mooreana]